MGCGHEDDRDEGELLTTGDMARLGNSTLRTVRFYEQEGLLHASGRTCGSHRRFPRSELRKLEAVSGLREAGLSLDEIRTLIALKQGTGCPQQASSRVCGALADQRARIDARIAVLEQMRAQLDGAQADMSQCQNCQCADFPSDCACCERVGKRSGLTHLVWKN